VDGAWLVLGVIVLLYYFFQKREAWLRNAGAALGESDDDLAMAKVGPGKTARVP
jgi:hypothetical protein